MPTLKNKKSLQSNAKGLRKLDTIDLRLNKATSANSVLPQLAVTCKIETECSYQTFVKVDRAVLRNRQLRQHANRSIYRNKKYRQVNIIYFNMTHDLSARLRELFLNGKWIAHTNLKEQITGTSWEEAVRQVANLNTIAQLTFHICYYLNGLINVFEGGALEIKDKFSFDMPEITSEEDWSNLVNEFIRSSEKFIYHIEKMDDAFLHQPFIKKEYGSYLRNVEAQIEHGYYHLGQIVLIKKILLQKNKESLPYSAC